MVDFAKDLASHAVAVYELAPLVQGGHDRGDLCCQAPAFAAAVDLLGTIQHAENLWAWGLGMLAFATACLLWPSSMRKT
eukprot:scaffold192392_cov22-Tisochrysis_lutea.AAC.1